MQARDLRRAREDRLDVGDVAAGLARDATIPALFVRDVGILVDTQGVPDAGARRLDQSRVVLVTSSGLRCPPIIARGLLQPAGVRSGKMLLSHSPPRTGCRDDFCVASSTSGQKAAAEMRDFELLRGACRRSEVDEQTRVSTIYGGTDAGDFAGSGATRGNGERDVPAPRFVAVRIVSLAGGGAERLGQCAEAGCQASAWQE